MADKQFTWIPFFTELAKALLSCKQDRKPLIDWIYSELSKVGGGKSLVSYLKKEKGGAEIEDIDPFSVFAIFNRGSLSTENRRDFLSKFKEKFALQEEVPTDFDGIPTVFAMKAFFFNWEENNSKVINDFWDLFENIVNENDIGISKSFDQVLANKMSKYSLTMVLYWICPNKYVALDQRNRSYFKTFGFEADNSNFNYETYMKIVDNAKSLMEQGTIPCSSFPELSYNAWQLSNTKRIWMFKGDRKTFQSNTIRMGSSAGNGFKFEGFKSKSALGDAYRETVGNKDVSIPKMYWQFIHEVKVGDVVVVFDTRKDPKPQHHLLYGWGRISSEVTYDYENDNPICHKVVWHHPQPSEPIKETKTKSALFLHDVKGTEAANIKILLKIDESNEIENMEENNQLYSEYIKLLKTNHNLILTGAPGTGKTFCARQIAKDLIGLKSVEDLEGCTQYGFVQFHPSYDYSDFVEGLRPKNDANGNVGFDRKDGVFKEFCIRALKNEGVGSVDNFEESWDKLVEELNEKEFIDIPMLSNKNTFRIELNEYGTGLATRTYEEDNTTSKTWIKGKSKFFNKEQLYNIYRGLPGIPSGGHDNYRKAVVAYMKETLGLKVYKAAIENGKNNRNYVFVIDEINRGEISKIFGELFFSIDPGYRGKEGQVKTQYANLVEEPNEFDVALGAKDYGHFYVPENIYIIGTMNDIDRSVESMDFAMRRRFAWKEVTARDSMVMLDNSKKFKEKNVSQSEIINIKERMQKLNEAILKTRELSMAYQIGASYFLKYADYKNFDELWEYHLKGLLAEYLRGNVDSEIELQKLKDAYNLKNETNKNEGQPISSQPEGEAGE